MNNKTSGEGGGGAVVRFRPIQRAGVVSAFGRFDERGRGGGVLSAYDCVRKNGQKRGLQPPKTPTTACKKKDFGQKGGLQPPKAQTQPPPPPPPPPPPCIRPCRCE